MQNADRTAELRTKLDLLLSQDLSSMGYEAQASHRRRVKRLERDYNRAMARLQDVPSTPREPAFSPLEQPSPLD